MQAESDIIHESVKEGRQYRHGDSLLVYTTQRLSKTNPVETSSILAPSGLEKDVDDPADNVIHDPRELGIPSKSRLKRSSSDDIDNFSDDGDVVYELSDIGHEFYTGQGDGDVNKDNTNFAFVEEDIDINSGYSSWGPWSVCSRTCGIGHKRRERKCTGQQHCTGDFSVLQASYEID
ncbi:hypothetical protein CHS0354_030388 [Potamilus streckersoni]|uniref:Uncharacterized protein n=1 Tax=Potamilus streckersoni TaxID=2493646 RepID=A0AAE0VSA2_9BIVA|nr:hypothetical protein CHS0354_030388 [Potamilus streckersoni]